MITRTPTHTLALSLSLVTAAIYLSRPSSLSLSLSLYLLLLLLTLHINITEKFVGPVPDPLLNWVTELSNVSADQRWILLENLKAATVYQFRVSAVNRVGEGSPSEPSNIVELPQEGECKGSNIKNCSYRSSSVLL